MNGLDPSFVKETAASGWMKILNMKPKFKNSKFPDTEYLQDSDENPDTDNEELLAEEDLQLMQEVKEEEID